MISTRQRLQGFIEKRIMTETGWRYFCADCNDYHEESKFYRQQGRPFGLMGTCSQSKKGVDKNPDKQLQHLKLGNVTADDIAATIDLLNTLGYNTYGNVHEQFLIRHKLDANTNYQRLENPQSTYQRRSSK